MDFNLNKFGDGKSSFRNNSDANKQLAWKEDSKHQILLLLRMAMRKKILLTCNQLSPPVTRTLYFIIIIIFFIVVDFVIH